MIRKHVLNMMNDRMQEIVIDAVGDFDTYMRNLIESEVFKIKTSNKAVLAIESATETGA